MTQSNFSNADDGAALRVLVVDDHEDMLSMMDILMQRRQYAVKTALNGPDALRLVSDFSPHVVVSDIGMPGMDGYQLMEELRATPDLAPFKSIALSGYDLKSEHERAREAGYDAHLTKPIEFEQLFQVIDELTGDMRVG